LLLSPCDKRPEKSADRREKVDPRMRGILRQKLRRFSAGLGRLPLGRARSGLRTLTPDGRFVVGRDGRQKGFFWVAGLGGHGVTTCFSVGRLAADLILGKRTDAKMTRSLSPSRFLK
jgi:glycine/D-amino acid oxidase-like deaminating enzyme